MELVLQYCSWSDTGTGISSWWTHSWPPCLPAPSENPKALNHKSAKPRPTCCPPLQGFSRVEAAHNESLLREALFSRGPLAVSIDASGPAFRFYSSGVSRSSLCARRRRLPRSSLCATGCPAPLCAP